MARTSYWDSVVCAVSADTLYGAFANGPSGIVDLRQKNYWSLSSNTSYWNNTSVNRTLLPRPDPIITHYNRASIKVQDSFPLRFSADFNATNPIGSGDWTLSFWIRIPSSIVSSARTLAIFGDNSLYGCQIISNITTGNITFTIYQSTGGAQNVVTTTQLVVGTWTHIAVCRSGTSVRCFIDGVLKGTVTINAGTTFSTTYREVSIGGSLSDSATATVPCNLEDILITNNALYTTAFTPPTTKLSEYSASFTGDLTEDLTEFGFTAYAYDLTYGELVGQTGNIDTAPGIFPKAFTINHSSRSEYYVWVKPNQGVPWLPSVTRVIGDKVYPTTLNTGIKYYQCTTAGTSGTTEPTWPSTGTVTDGTVTWLVAGDWNPGVFKGPYTREG